MSRAEADRQKLSGLLEHLMSNEMVLDGVLAQDQTQFASLWSLRELLPEACGKAGSVYKYDLSVPVGKMYGLVEKMRKRLRDEGLLVGDGQKEGPIRACVGYGHMGDGEFVSADPMRGQELTHQVTCTSTLSPTSTRRR
jgi:FAD/FMN-containing dehydrogenase